MKNFSRFITFTLLMCSIAVIFSACNNDEHNEIAAAYAKQLNVDKSEIDFTCFLEIEGTHILMFNTLYPDALSEETVDGVVFHHDQVKTFDVYNNGIFYSLQEAFNNGLVSHENLLTLRDLYNRNPQYSE